MGDRSSKLCRALICSLVTLAGIDRAAAQEGRPTHSDSAAAADRVTVRAGARYDAGPLLRFLMGSEYRDAWTARITVPVLRLDTFAGGLRPTERGNGKQTISLVFEGANGRQYVFRSVDKQQKGGLHKDFRGTLVEAIAQDDVTSKYPAAPVAVSPLLDAAHVLNARPTLTIMADDPALGEFRKEFAGMLGAIEERAKDSVGLNGVPYPNVISTDHVMERLDKSSKNRIDAKAYATARLIDILVGDWDRHPDQWRWAEVERDGLNWWVPIPRDRDNAFSSIGGVTAAIYRAIRSTAVVFGPNYGSIKALTYNARELDSRFLSELPRATWDSIATAVQHEITDDVIANAFRSFPDAFRPITARSLEPSLRRRRDLLATATTAFYDELAYAVDVYGTEDADRATVQHEDDGRTRVRMYDGKHETPYFDRTFIPGETHEVRIYLGKGADTAVITGHSKAIGVRVIGGAGNDVLNDSTVAGQSALVAFYDDSGSNEYRTTSRTHLDRRSYVAHKAVVVGENNTPPALDRGFHGSLFAPGGAWPVEIGPVIGVGPRWTQYGFRRFPFAYSWGVRVLYAPLHDRFGIAADMRILRTGGGSETRFSASATAISFARFNGYGNETGAGPMGETNRIWAPAYRGAVQRHFWLTPRLRVAAGPTIQYLQPEVPNGSVADVLRPLGSTAFGAGGVAAEAELDSRNSRRYPRSGVRIQVHATGYPLVWGDAPEAFARGDFAASGYVPLPLPLEPTIALRAAGSRVWGNAPLQEAAFVGGPSTLRGFEFERFAGQSELHANAELRTRVGRVNLLLVKGELGAIALADAGRVFVNGENSSQWHHAYGGGLWFGILDRAAVASLVYAKGEIGVVYLTLGMPF
jgi:hypothetical protein